MNARIVLAVVASVLVHAATLALPPGDGGVRWSAGASNDVPLLLVLEPSPPEPLVTAVTSIEHVTAVPAPVAVVAPRAVATAPGKSAGPKLNPFGFSMFRVADGESQQQAFTALGQSGVDLPPDAVATMSGREFAHIGFSEDWRGTLRAIAAAVVNTEGAVEDVVVIDADEPFAGYVATIVRGMTFEPARRNGERVNGYAVLTVDFCPAGAPATCPAQPVAPDRAPPSPPARASN